MNKLPKPKSLASYLSWQIELSGKKQFQIAEDCGFNKPNIITMIKQGKTRLPRDKVLKMANSLAIDPIDLMKRMFTECYPEEWEMLETILCQPPLNGKQLEIMQLTETIGEEEALRLLQRHLQSKAVSNSTNNHM